MTLPRIAFAFATSLLAAQDPTQPPRPIGSPDAPVVETLPVPQGSPGVAAAAPWAGYARLDFGFGFGRFEHDTKGAPQLSDSTDGSYVRLGFELVGDSGFGGGLRLDGYVSDDDLFVDTLGARGEASFGQLFLHGTAHTAHGRFELPLRFGLFLGGYSLEDVGTNATVDWASFGFRIELEPDLALVQSDGMRWSLYGTLGAQIGDVEVSTDPRTIGSADSDMTGFDLSIGTRWRFKNIDFGLSFLWSRLRYDDSDAVGGFYYRGFAAEFTGLLVTSGIRF